MVPPLFAVVGGLSAGAWTDRMIRRGVSVTLARKLPLCLGLLLSSSIALTEFVTVEWAVLLLLSFAFATTIAASPGIWCIPGDIAPSPNFVGTIGAIQNTFSNVAGVVAPLVTGLILAHTGSFEWALIASGVIAATGALSYWFVVGELSPIELIDRDL